MVTNNTNEYYECSFLQRACDVESCSRDTFPEISVATDVTFFNLDPDESTSGYSDTANVQRSFSWLCCNPGFECDSGGVCIRDRAEAG
jgi:hypothetical protein